MRIEQDDSGLDQPGEPGYRQRAAATKRERTRSALVQAASRLLGQGGEVNMRDIAREAGVSVATAYHYFDSVDDVAASFYFGLFEFITGDLYVIRPDPVGIIREYLHEIANRLRRYPEAPLRIIELMGHHNPRSFEEGFVSAGVIHEPLTRMIAYGVQEGVFRQVEEYKVASYHLYALITLSRLSPTFFEQDVADMVMSQLMPTLQDS
jgi:AcrR family transcriptional regulator